MANFSELIITTKGHELKTRILAGDLATEERTPLTKIVTSSAVYQLSDIEALTSLDGIQQETLVSSVTKTNQQTIRIHGVMNNNDLTTGYRLNTVGVFFKFPDDPQEYLYGATIHIGTFEEPNADFIFPFNGQSSTGMIFNLEVEIGNADKISLVVDPAAVVTVQMLEGIKILITNIAKSLDMHKNDVDVHEKAFDKHNLDPNANPAAINKHNKDPDAHDGIQRDIETLQGKVPTPTREHQMIISDVNNPENRRYQLLDVNSRAQPVTFFTHENEFNGLRLNFGTPTSFVPQSVVIRGGTANFPTSITSGTAVATIASGNTHFIPNAGILGRFERLPTPFPASLTHFVDWRNNTLVPRHGGFTLTSHDTTTVADYWGTANSARENQAVANSRIVANMRILPQAGAMSIRFKIRRNRALTGNLWILSENPDFQTNSQANGGINITGSGNVVSIGFIRSGQLVDSGVHTGITLNDNRWRDILFTWTGAASGAWRFFVDGRLIHSGTSVSGTGGTNNGGTRATTEFMRMANAADAGAFTLGDVEIYNSVIEPSIFNLETWGVPRFLTAFTQNALGASTGVNLGSFISGEGPILGSFTGTGEINVGFAPSVVMFMRDTIAMDNQHGISSAPLINAPIGVDVRINLQPSNSQNVNSNIVVSKTATGFNVSHVPTALVPIRYVLWR